MNEHDAFELAYKNGYENGKADAVAEIFAEIYNILDYLKLYNPCDDLLKAIIYRIAKLKKKYTEGGE